MSIEDTIREVVRAEVRSALREVFPDRGSAPSPTSDDGYLSIARAAELAEVHPDTVRGWMKEGRLARHQAGRELRVRRSDLHAFLAAAPAAPGQPTPEAEATGILSKRRRG